MRRTPPSATLPQIRRDRCPIPVPLRAAVCILTVCGASKDIVLEGRSALGRQILDIHISEEGELDGNTCHRVPIGHR